MQLLVRSETAGVPEIVRTIQDYRSWTEPELRRIVEESAGDPKARLHARLALLPVDASQVPFLEEHLLGASPPDILVLREALQPHRSTLIPQLWAVLESAKPADARILPAACALALYDPDGPRWTDRGGKVADALVKLNPVFLGPWLDALRRVRGRLTPPLDAIFRDPTRVPEEHGLATDILARYAADDPERLAGLMMVSDPKAFGRFFSVVEPEAARATPVFQAELAGSRAATENTAVTEEDKDHRAERQARAAVALFRLGHTDQLWPLLRHSADPRLRSFIVNWLAPLGADPKTIAGA